MSTPRLTDAQRSACEAQHHVVVEAAAGSGKTRVLVERYLTLLFRDAQRLPQDILAITFTRRATAEMRHRLRERLREISESDSEHQTQATACLENFHRAAVMTIHGFANEVLRSHPFEADLDPDYVVSDEVLSGQVKHDTVMEMIQEIISSESKSPLRPPTRDLLRKFGAKGVEALIRLASYEDAPTEALHTMATHTEQTTLDQSRALWESHVGDVLLGFLGDASNRESIRRIADCVTTGLRDDSARANRWPEIAKTLLSSDTPLSTKAMAFTQAMGLLLGSSGEHYKGAYHSVYGKKGVWDASIHGELSQLVPELGAVVQPINEGWIPWDEKLEVEAARLSKAMAMLACEARERIRKRKDLEGWLDYGDQLRMAAALVDREPVSVTAPLAKRFEAILIDEFQDTDPNQWRLVKAILDQRAALPLMLVGDPRQSIYAFRGAQVKLFDEARRDLASRATDEFGFLDQDMSENHRSTAPLVHLINGLFQAILSAEPNGSEIMPSPAIEACSTLTPSPASMHFIPTPYHQTDRDGRENEARAVASVIKKMLSDKEAWAEETWGQGFTDDWRPKPGHIALLFRKSTGIPEFERRLRELDIPVNIAASGGLSKRQEIWDLRHLLRAIVEPTDDEALLGLLRTPWMGWSDDLLLKLTILTDGFAPRNARPLWERLVSAQRIAHGDIAYTDEEWECIKRTEALIRRAQAQAAHLAPAEVAEQILTATGAWGLTRLEPEGERRIANLRRGLARLRRSRARGFEAMIQVSDDLNRLIQDEAKEAEEQISTGERSAVTIMTIHGAKGLQFPIVFMPEMGSTGRSNQSSEILRWHGDFGLGLRLAHPEGEMQNADSARMALAKKSNEATERAEEIRLLYVAMTRAERLLFLSGQVSDDLDKCEKPRFGDSALSMFFPALNIQAGDLAQAHLSPPWSGDDIIPVLKPEPIAVEGSSNDQDSDETFTFEIPDSVVEQVEPIRPTAESLTPIAVTELNLFAQCPNRHLLERRMDAPQSQWFGITEPPVNGNAIELGNAFHGLMEIQVRDLSLRPDQVAAQWRARHRDEAGVLPRAEDFLQRTRDMDLWRRLGEADELLPEQDILIRTPVGTLRGRVDLLLRKGDEWEIVDHKTGKGTGDDTALIAPHRLQMECYLLFLRAHASNQSRYRVSLAHPRSGREVALDHTAAEVDAIAERVHEQIAQFCAGQGKWHHVFPNAECGHCPFQRHPLCEKYANRADLPEEN